MEGEKRTWHVQRDSEREHTYTKESIAKANANESVVKHIMTMNAGGQKRMPFLNVMIRSTGYTLAAKDCN